MKRTTSNKGRPKSLDADQEAAVIADYAAGKSLTDIAATRGVHVQTVKRSLEDYGVDRRPKINRKDGLNEDQESKVIEALRAGACGRDLAAAYNTSPSTISNIRKRAGLAPGQQGRRVEKIVDHDAFRDITPSSCYWTGMLFADGCVDYDHGTPQIILELARRDRKHVEKFRAFLKSDYAISDVLHKSSYSRSGLAEASAFRARSQPIADALQARGLAPKKIDRLPTAEMIASRDFWRGMIDGDGWVGTALSKGEVLANIGLSGRRPILEAFCRVLRERGLCDPTIHPTDSGVFKVNIQGKAAEQIVAWLYCDCVVALDRKNVRAQTIISGDFAKTTPRVEYLPNPEIPVPQ